MAKKDPAKKIPAKRKPRPKKPVVPAVEPIVESSAWRSVAFQIVPCLLAFVFGAGTGIWSAGGIPIGPDGGGKRDVLSRAHTADRVSQIAVLRELAEQPFDGATADGRRKAGEWFNANRFRNRPDDYGAYTDKVSEAIAANSEAKLADALEAK